MVAEAKIRFSSSILPKWARRTKSLDALLPVLYLRGVSTGDFQEALAALLGKDAPNLSPAVISRLTAEWQADYDAWQKRDLSARRLSCTCGRTGSICRPEWKKPPNACWCWDRRNTRGQDKELVGFQHRGTWNAQSWRELLIDLKQRSN